MGLDPDDDEDVQITDGNPFLPPPWDIRTWWTIAGGKCTWNRLTAVENGCRQYNLDLQIGNVYKITMVLDSINMVNPAKGVYWVCGSHTSPVYTVAGTYEKTFLIDNTLTSFAFLTNSLNVGDQGQIGSIILEQGSNYVRDILGINWSGPQKYEFYKIAANEYWQNCASRNGHDKCLVKFNT